VKAVASERSGTHSPSSTDVVHSGLAAVLLRNAEPEINRPWGLALRLTGTTVWGRAAIDDAKAASGLWKE